MDDPTAARLPDVLRISGADAEKFLQAQLTCDVSSIVAGHGLPFAWCTPKGRVRHSGWLLHTGDGYTLLTSPGRAAALAEALQRFVFRDRVVMNHHQPGLAIEYPANGAAVENEGTDCFELGGPHRRIRLVEGQPRRQDAAAFALAGIAAGVWELTGEFEEAYLPQMLNLDLVGGVSFRKGCYPGQEVIARTHNLGRVTRRMLRLGGEGPPPGAGTAVLAGQTRAGEILASAPENHGAVMLAVIRLDALGGEPLALAHGPRLELLPLPYPVPELDEGP